MKHLLPATELEAAIRALDEAFHGQRRHDLWDNAGNLLCADPKEQRVAKAQKAGLENLSFGDLDYLTSCAGLTIGTRETVRFLTPRYLRAVLSYPKFGWYTNDRMLLDRLERFGFDAWPRDQRAATAEALVLMGRAMVLMADEYDDFSETDGAKLIEWAEAKRAVAQAEIERRKHKAGTPRRKALRR